MQVLYKSDTMALFLQEDMYRASAIRALCKITDVSIKSFYVDVEVNPIPQCPNSISEKGHPSISINTVLFAEYYAARHRTILEASYSGQEPQCIQRCPGFLTCEYALPPLPSTPTLS